MTGGPARQSSLLGNSQRLLPASVWCANEGVYVCVCVCEGVEGACVQLIVLNRAILYPDRDVQA